MNNNLVDILGVRINAISMDRMVEWLGNLDRREVDLPIHVATPNPEMVLESIKNDHFRMVLNNTGINIPDGIGLLMAADFLSYGVVPVPLVREVQVLLQGLWVGFKGVFAKDKFMVIPERVSGADFFEEVIKFSERRGWSVFLLGSEQGAAYDAQVNILNKYPNLKIAGIDEGGVVDKNGRTSNDSQIVEKINASQAEVLVVCFGSPKQDLWIANNKVNLSKTYLAMGAGGTLDYWARKRLRAPKIMQKLSLEWLWRLLIEPTRWRRIWRAFPVFAFIVAVNKFHVIKYGYGRKQKRNDLQKN